MQHNLRVNNRLEEQLVGGGDLQMMPSAASGVLTGPAGAQDRDGAGLDKRERESVFGDEKQVDCPGSGGR